MNNCGTNNGIIPGLYDGMCKTGNAQITGVNDVIVIIANVIRILEAFAAGLAIIAIIVSGIYYVASAGDPGRIKTAKTILTQAIIGLVLIILAYAIVTYIAAAF